MGQKDKWEMLALVAMKMGEILMAGLMCGGLVLCLVSKFVWMEEQRKQGWVYSGLLGSLRRTVWGGRIDVEGD